jgi:hypothetical protein
MEHKVAYQVAGASSDHQNFTNTSCISFQNIVILILKVIMHLCYNRNFMNVLINVCRANFKFM